MGETAPCQIAFCADIVCEAKVKAEEAKPVTPGVPSPYKPFFIAKSIL